MGDARKIYDDYKLAHGIIALHDRKPRKALLEKIPAFKRGDNPTIKVRELISYHDFITKEVKQVKGCRPRIQYWFVTILPSCTSIKIRFLLLSTNYYIPKLQFCSSF